MISKIVQYLINKNVLDEEDKDIYEYGLFVFCFNLANIFSVILIGFLLDKTLFSIIFLFSFIPVRMLAGGFHFKLASLCCIFFNTCLLIILLLTKLTIYPPTIVSIICIILLIIFTYIEYKPRLKILVPLYVFLFIEAFLILQNNSNLYIISYAILFNTVLYFINKIVNIGNNKVSQQC